MIKPLGESFSPKTITPITPRASEGLRAPRGGRLAAPVVATLWEVLLWAYGRQKVHLGGGDREATGYAPISATGAVVERLRLGVAVDCSRRASAGSSGLSGGCDGDALTVHRYVGLLGRYRGLVMEAAIIGEMPEWAPRIPPLRYLGPILRGNGQPKMDYHNHRPVSCPMRIEGIWPEDAERMRRHARRVYGEWWAVMSVLCDALRRDRPLARWAVSGVGAVAMPWAEARPHVGKCVRACVAA